MNTPTLERREGQVKRISIISVHGCPCIPPGGIDAGGMNVYVRQTAKHLSAQNISVKIFSHLHSSALSPCVTLDEGVQLIHVPAGDPSLTKNELPQELEGFTRFVSQYADSRSWKPQIVVSHYWLSGIVAEKLATEWKASHIASFHTLAHLKPAAQTVSMEHLQRVETEPRIARQADSIVSWTDEEASLISEVFGAERDRIETIPPGVDLHMFKPKSILEARRQLNVEARIVLLFVGRLDPVKGVDLAIEACAMVRDRHPDIMLQIVGGGSIAEFEQAWQSVREHQMQDHVEMLGVQPYHTMPNRYAAADLLIAPSMHETFGMAVLEAAACGTPAIVAKVGGLATIVRDRINGYLIDNRNPREYADKIITLIENPALRQEMSQAAYGQATNFPWEKSVDKLTELYNRLSLSNGMLHHCSSNGHCGDLQLSA